MFYVHYLFSKEALPHLKEKINHPQPSKGESVRLALVVSVSVPCICSITLASSGMRSSQTNTDSALCEICNATPLST